jgi:signal transduction histidine kinase
VIQRRSHEDQKPVTIQKAIDPRLPLVLGDLDRVRQVLDNLLDNAYLYNTPNGKITIRMRPVGGEVQVEVVDTGLGIPVSEQPRLFERFFRGENPLVLGVPGTGLGLSIVQNLVQMHHGRIWLESSGMPGEGSTISFTLPVYIP